MEMEWDDVRIFLALVRAGSVRSAAKTAGVSHSTVARRIERFEKRMGVKLFDRVATGYALTEPGEDLLDSAETVETELHAVHRRLVGQDRRLAGNICVTTVDIVATHFLMPNLRQFRDDYPDIHVEVIMTYEALDLTRREADIAIRFVKNPPDHLIGHRLASVADATYATQAYIDSHDLTDPESASWIGYGGHNPFPNWVKRSDYPHLPAKGVFDSMLLQLHAVRYGLGIANIPCFIADTDPTLVRLPPKKPRHGEDLWLLRHCDTRSTARLQVFSKFVVDIATRSRPLLEGVLRP